MEKSPFPAPLDILRTRADELSKLIEQNSGKISECTVAMSLLQNGQTTLEVKVLNANTGQGCYSFCTDGRSFFEQVFLAMRSGHAELGRERARLFDMLAQVTRQLKAMGITEPATEMRDQ